MLLKLKGVRFNMINLQNMAEMEDNIDMFVFMNHLKTKNHCAYATVE